MLLEEEVKSFLDQMSFAALCTALDLGSGREAILVVKSSGDLLGSLRNAAAMTRLGWVVEDTAAGPVICLLVRTESAGSGDLLAEVYFDAASEGDWELLGLFARQGLLRVVFLDEEGSLVWTAQIPWDEVRRLEAEQVADRAEEFLERCPAPDFEAAKALFQESLPLDRLAARAFNEA